MSSSSSIQRTNLSGKLWGNIHNKLGLIILKKVSFHADFKEAFSNFLPFKRNKTDFGLLIANLCRIGKITNDFVKMETCTIVCFSV